MVSITLVHLLIFILSPSDAFLFVFLMSFYLYFSLRCLPICISDVFLFVFLSPISFYLYFWYLSICISLSDVFLFVLLSLMSFYLYVWCLSNRISLSHVFLFLPTITVFKNKVPKVTTKSFLLNDCFCDKGN